jgi:hypothetical protein
MLTDFPLYVLFLNAQHKQASGRDIKRNKQVQN